jgi:hypothetical protein
MLESSFSVENDEEWEAVFYPAFESQWYILVDESAELEWQTTWDLIWQPIWDQVSELVWTDVEEVNAG